jgi:hypothetical protein
MANKKSNLIDLLKFEEELLKEKRKLLDEKKTSILDKLSLSSSKDIDGGIKKKSLTFIESIKNFFKSEFYHFIKNYLFFFILFSVSFYILLYITNNAKI